MASRAELVGFNHDINDTSTLQGDSETKRLEFFDLDELPANLMDADLVEAYKSYIKMHKQLGREESRMDAGYSWPPLIFY